MKRRVIAIVLMVCLLLCPTAFAAADGAWTLESITWQDPQNAVLQWEHTQGSTYEIYRSDTESGSYQLIGTASAGSYRDNEARYPNASFYKVLRIEPNGTKGPLSAPMKTGTNPQPVHNVPVIMYHHFVSALDIKNGVEFGEYAMSPQDFEADLLWLRSNGYTTITSNELLESLYGNRPLPAKPIILSIDDGSKGVFDNAWPLLEKYNMKADLNIIGERIDEAWETVHEGGSRDGESAPYCTWNEVRRMANSGTINICSHTYGLHRYNSSGRIGLQMKDGETLEEYIQAVKNDFTLVTSSLTGWTGIVPKTVAYPYSRRSSTTDWVLLENTPYEILMAGEGARRTKSNYFVEGASRESALTLMSRPCRMDGYPIESYLTKMNESDYKNGVNRPENTTGLSAARCAEIAAWYSPFHDVAAKAWYAGSVYYAYANGLMAGTGPAAFSPSSNIDRAMAAVLLHRMADKPDSQGTAHFSDVAAGQWYSQAAAWAAESGVLPGLSDGTYRPNGAITREELALCMYQCARYLGQDCSMAASLDKFTDAGSISPQMVKAMEWAVARGIYQGNGNGTITPKGKVTRAEMTKLLQNWNLAVEA